MNRQNRVAQLLVTVALGTLVAGPAWAAGTLREQGAFASMYEAVDVTGCRHVYLSVDRTTEATDAHVLLIYSVFDGCTSTSVAFGYGFIPGTAFTVSSSNIAAPHTRASLNLTISPNSESFTSEGEIGTINLTFVRTGAYFKRFVGTEQIDEAGFALTARGTWSETSANVNGTVLGATIADADGVVGSSKTRYVELIKK
jgi:hypothetical protein